jgi:hypothetical protein
MTTAIAPEKLSALAKDLSLEPPRSPREKLGGYIIAARLLDKCRAHINGTFGQYNFGHFMDNLFFDFTGIESESFKTFVATGATDEEVGRWIQENSKQQDPLIKAKWNNNILYATPREMPERFQLYMEDYIAQNVPKHRPVYHVFDIFDLEEGRL